MGKSVTNIAVILGAASIAFAGYYLYTEFGQPQLSFDANEQTMQKMLNKTRAYIDYNATLQKINLDYSFFEDERLLSLQSFTTPIADSPIGRPDPFADVPGRDSSPSS